MGVKLVAEVLLYAPDTLTHREKLAAVALAEDARDRTRQTWNSVVSPKILKGAEVKTEREMLKIIAKLKAKGVLKQLVSGRKGVTAKFEFLPLAPASALDDLADSQGGQFDHPMDDLADSQGGGFEHPMEASGWSNRVVRVADLNTPTPQSPHSSSSSSDATAAPHGGDDDEKINDKGKTHTPAPVADLHEEAAIRHIVDRKIGIDRDQARAIVAHIRRMKVEQRQTPVANWVAYLARFTDDQLHAYAVATGVGHPVVAAPPLAQQAQDCPECRGMRRLMDDQGADLGPCRLCNPTHPDYRPAADTPAERIAQ